MSIGTVMRLSSVGYATRRGYIGGSGVGHGLTSAVECGVSAPSTAHTAATAAPAPPNRRARDARKARSRTALVGRGRQLLEACHATLQTESRGPLAERGT